MTTAYNFPDLNISPISIVDEEDIAGIRDRRVEDFQHTLPVHVPLEQSLKGLSISDSTPSGNPSVVPDSDPIRLEAASEDEYHGSLVTARTSSGDRRTGHSHVSLRLGDSFDESSEEAFIALENRMKHSLFSVAESCDIASASQDSFCYILSGCCVCVEMGCCKESSSDVRSCLRRMGAVVSRRFTETTTHVVFSYGGSTEILQSVFASSTRPFLVDPHWVHECFKTQTRVPEENFSLYECRYLVNALRRSLDQQNISGCRSIVLQNITNENGHVTHGNISELDLLSKRLDKIGAATTCVLGNRCPSVLKGKHLRPEFPPICPSRTAHKGVATVKITRRRTHGAFPLEYREPSSIAVKLVQESREEQAAICGRPSKSRMDNSDLLKENEEPRSTQACDLPLTSKRDAVSRTKKIVSEQQGTQFLKSPRKCLVAVENSSELGGLLGLKTPSQQTASSLINELQSASSSAEFVGRRQTTRITNKTRDGVVFTGFVKEIERELYPHVRDLGLKVHSKISARTYCLVSANGERTLNTLRAVVMGIPVVTPDWVEMCVDYNRLLPLDKFEHKRWKELIQKRARNCNLFDDYGPIMVCEDCAPPSDVLKWLIEESGGELTTDPQECSLIVAPAQHSLEILCSEEMGAPPPVVIEKYILDCICENAVLDVDDYMEHQVVDDLL
ncbi:hypothetical protein RB195_004255 [Necator americanus]|uniref:BRCT domain-containing protein n=1 Tax=Necator americanus TaxID=51031 RepID=A0ABR1BKG5_NECAM